METKIIQKKKIYDEVAEHIVELIKQGKLRPGDRLDSVEQLSKQFEVGRSTIREALTALRAKGLIELKQGEGTFVKNFDKNTIGFPLTSGFLMTEKDIKELLEVRRVLEIGIVEKAAVNRTEEDLEALRLLYYKMKEHINLPKIGEQADVEFHLALVKATHNTMLQTLYNNISTLMMEVIHDTRLICLYDVEHNFDILNRQHKRILEAIIAEDPFQASEAMEDHIQFVEEVLDDYSKKKRKPQ